MRGLGSLSLLWKILLSTSIAITLLFALIGWFVQDQFVRIATQGLEEEVRSSFQAYDSLWKARAEQLSSVALVLSRMSDVRAAFSTRDPATIRDSAGEVWEQVAHSRGLFLVTDPGGSVVAALGARPSQPIREVAAVRDAAPRFPAQVTGFLSYDERLFQIVVTPVYVASSHGSALLNVLVTGFPVDEVLAQALREATGGSEFVFRSRGRVLASSIGPPPPGGSGSERLILLRGIEYLQSFITLSDAGGQPVGELRILRSFGAARARITELRTRIIFLWVAAILAGLGLTFLQARRLLRPVHALDQAAARIAEGSYDAQVLVESEDEIGRLARTFNAMCASLRGAREELIRQERISTISRLSTSIIHDLRNPLAAIYGGAEMMVDSDLSPSQVKRLAANIYRSSRRVQDLLQELSGVAGGRAHARESCRLREVVIAARDAIVQNADAHQVEIFIQVDEVIELALDRSPMERVFQNLLSNAIEAMPMGGRVTVVAARRDAAVLVSMEDTGPGIPAALLPQLFQPFVTSGKRNGIGLGLALSRQTVLDHGGDLWADPELGPGARFWLRLPA